MCLLCFGICRTNRTIGEIESIKAAARTALERLEQREKEELALLGAPFVEKGQRVRLTCSGMLQGQCGTIVQRAQLCYWDRLQIVTRSARDASGALKICAPEQHHRVKLDPVGDDLSSMLTALSLDDEQSVSPTDIELWPALGQQVLHLGDDDPNEIATR